MSKAVSLLCSTGPAARRKGWSSPVAAIDNRMCSLYQCNNRMCSLYEWSHCGAMFASRLCECTSPSILCVECEAAGVAFLCLYHSRLLAQAFAQQRLTLREQALTWQRWNAWQRWNDDCTSPCQIDSAQPALRPCRPPTILRQWS